MCVEYACSSLSYEGAAYDVVDCMSFSAHACMSGQWNS